MRKVTVLILLILLTSIVQASWRTDQEWGWDQSAEDVDGTPIEFYRIYWSTAPNFWYQCQMFSFVASDACDTPDSLICHGEGGRCCGDIPEPPDPIVFFQWTAVDVQGDESTWTAGVKEDCP